MNINDILKLINAGYTKAEIDALTSDQPDAESAADPVPDSKPDNTAVPDNQESSTVPTSSDDPVMKELAAIKQQMSKLAISKQAADIPDEKDALAEALKKLIGD